jgi:glutathione synthase/RimK-type ligase-like ATP-grasp enzyme
MTAPVALVTAQPARALDDDLQPLMAALDRRGVAHEVVIWDDPAVDWRRFRSIVVRSTWDYAARRGSFLAWAGRAAAAAPLHNPLAVLRWTTDKRYLADLEAAGVAIVPSRWCPPGAAPELPDGSFVVKPSVGAGSVGAARFAADEHAAAVAHVARLHAAGHVALIQPYLAGVERAGETALVFFGGEFSHAVRKAAILVSGMRMVGDLFAAEQIRATTPTPAEHAVALAALAAVPRRGPLLYARVDLVPDDDGAPRVLELELCEPSVFLNHAEGAADRFAAAIAALRPGLPGRTRATDPGPG